MNFAIYLKIPRHDNPIMHHVIGLDSSMLSSRCVKTQTAYCIAPGRVSMTAIKWVAADLSISITVGNTTSSDSFIPISCITIATSTTRQNRFLNFRLPFKPANFMRLPYYNQGTVRELTRVIVVLVNQ